MKISKELDYNLYSNSERANQVRNLFTDEVSAYYSTNFESATAQAELEKIANFILYGKDPKTDKNSCEKNMVYGWIFLGSACKIFIIG